MSANNFWNNFTHGFMHGMFNSNPFFACNLFSPMGGMWGGFGFNSCFGGMSNWLGCGFGFNSLFTYPNVMNTMNFTPLMPDFAPPAFSNFDNMNFSPAFTSNKMSNFEFTSKLDSVFQAQLSNKSRTLTTDVWESSITKPSVTVPDVVTSVKSTPVAPATKASSIPANNAKMISTSVNDKYFDQMFNFIVAQEGGYSNDPVDRGGETYKGVTKKTYDAYRKKKQLPMQNVRKMTQNEHREIAYEFYKQSGADKIDNPQMALLVFDVAWGSGVKTAKKMFKESGGDLNKFVELRKKFYADIVKRRPEQVRFIKGWNNRLARTVTYASANLPAKSIA